jgi:hypothetical protein
VLVLRRQFEQRIEERAFGVGERALFDLGERERKGEMRVREMWVRDREKERKIERESQRERDLRELVKRMQTREGGLKQNNFEGERALFSLRKRERVRRKERVRKSEKEKPYADSLNNALRRELYRRWRESFA